MSLFIDPLFTVILYLLFLYKWVVLGAVIMSWLIAFGVVNTYHRVVYTINEVLTRLTEPALRPLRRFVPNLGGIDITPIILLLFVWLVEMEVGNLQTALRQY